MVGGITVGGIGYWSRQLVGYYSLSRTDRHRMVEQATTYMYRVCLIVVLHHTGYIPRREGRLVARKASVVHPNPLDIAGFAAVNLASSRVADHSSARSKHPAKRHRYSGHASMSPRCRSHLCSHPGHSLHNTLALVSLRDRTQMNVGIPPTMVERFPRTTLHPVLQLAPGFDEMVVAVLQVGILPDECAHRT